MTIAWVRQTRIVHANRITDIAHRTGPAVSRHVLVVTGAITIGWIAGSVSIARIGETWIFSTIRKVDIADHAMIASGKGIVTS